MEIFCNLINPNQFSATPLNGNVENFSRMMRKLGSQFSHGLRAYVMELETLEYLKEIPEITLKLDQSVSYRLSAKNNEKLEWIEAGKQKTKDLPIKPFPHQLEDIGRMLGDSQSYLNCNPIGLGKTLEALATLNPDDAVLVIATANTKGTWAGEVAKLKLTHKVEILSGRKSFRWPVPGEILITNYDLLPTRDSIKSLSSPPHKTVMIFDEAHKLKSPNSWRNQAAEILLFGTKSKAGLYSSGGKAIFLTGTPLENSPDELYQLIRLSRNLSGTFESWQGFMNAFDAKIVSGSIVWGMPSIQTKAKLRRILIMHDKERVINLPDRLYSEVFLECDSSVKKCFKQVEQQLKDLGIDLEEALRMSESDSDCGGDTSVATSLRMLAAAKMPAIIERIESYEEANEPVIVASAHRAGIDLLESRHGWAAIHGGVDSTERQKIVDRFQAGELKGLALTIPAAGEGLTLTRSCHMLFIDRHYNPAKNHQCEGRIYRIGAKRTCNYIDFLWDHPLEFRRKEIIRQKQLINHAAITSLTAMPEHGSGLTDDATSYWIKAAEAVVESDNCLHSVILNQYLGYYKVYGTLKNKHLDILIEMLITNYPEYLPEILLPVE